MKKIVALMAALILMMLAIPALAAAPGDTVTVPIYVNTSNAAYVKVRISGSWCTIVSLDSVYGQTSGKSINGQVNPVIPSGKFGSATIKINDGLASGDYTLTVSVSEAFDIDENDATASAYSGTVSVKAPECAHDFGEWVLNPAPTCTDAGLETRECSLCGEKETRDVEANGHSWNDGEQNKAPTCKDEGEKLFTCEVCGETKTEKIPVDPDKHSWDKGVTIPATCLEDGSTTFTCEICGEKDVSVIKARGSHNPDKDNMQVETAPTCTTNGKGSYTCLDCGEKVDGGAIAALGHDFGAWGVTTPATCTDEGEETRTCTRTGCGEKETRPIDALGHDKVVTTTAPTCGKDGKEVTTCSRTGCDFEETKVLQATGEHTTSETVTKEPTCGAKGEKKITCANCDYTKTEEIAPTGKHTYEESVTTEPGCETEGVKTFTCSVCDDSYTEKIPATGHTPGSDLKEQAPTCQKPGYKFYTCTVCGTEVKESDIPKVDHKYEVTSEVPATCTANGKRVSTCIYEGCGKTKTETLKKLGHKMGEWELTTPATCDKNGEETRVCMNGCGKTETRVVKAAHSWGEWVVDQEAGTKTHTCSECGKVEVKNLANRYVMTVCSYGIRFRDLANPITKDWYMFTPIDLSVEGEQTIDLIAGNMHKIGTATVLVREGTVTVTTKVNNIYNIAYEEEFLTFVPALADLTALDFDAMTNYAYGEAISIEEALGGDTKVLLLMRNRAWYEDKTRGVESFNGKGKDYDAYVEELKLLMD